MVTHGNKQPDVLKEHFSLVSLCCCSIWGVSKQSAYMRTVRTVAQVSALPFLIMVLALYKAEAISGRTLTQLSVFIALKAASSAALQEKGPGNASAHAGAEAASVNFRGDRTHGKSQQEDRGGKITEAGLKKSNQAGVDMCTDLYYPHTGPLKVSLRKQSRTLTLDKALLPQMLFRFTWSSAQRASD